MHSFSVLLAALALPSFVLGVILPRSPLLDVCAHVELNLFAELGLITDILDLLHLGLPIGVIGELDVCLCLSALPLFLTANVDAAAAVTLAGDTAVSGFLAAEINRLAGGQSCHYPPNSKAFCSPAVPCSWSCDTGYHKVGNQCLPVQTAPSPPVRRSVAPSCPMAGERVCGTANGKSQWECVNVLSELESCGGCTYAPPFPELAATTPLGTDCTSIPHVADVRCSRGACVVQKCDDGFVPSSDRSTCITTQLGSYDTSSIKASHLAHGHHVVSGFLGHMVGMVSGK
ncbi:hypothetical protein DACRYDRAFT_118871 [Dacryopinax primogenitus]|uniref:Protein CPL1-like domain-containing protein n=1 Tax=Dacryopinax primogenitus (strain DJM 731) TaxID=1858805 RepID=M5FP02_DACPD|nr:uncharacterized protein DACRYDRAFT_118871 [Dacryopinax primogenitus]EJT98110.1 hypothetical protein DACRYDRAFT_118871 [Dacryopinax primogenitus]